MDLLAITAQLSIVNGVIEDEGTSAGILARPAPPKPGRGREHDFLFVHLSLSGPHDETDDLARELVEALGTRFFAAAGSVTSALRRAVIETNETLLRHNVTTRSLHEGALSCAVLHNGELYSLQVGEGLAFLGHNFGIERLPARPPQHLTPLGRSAGIDIRFAFHQLQPGDMMLLGDPRMSYLTGETLAPVLVNTEIESGMDALLEVMAQDSARLLLVEFADELPSTLPLTFQHSRQPASRPPAKPAQPAIRSAPQPAAKAIPQPVSSPADAAPSTDDLPSALFDAPSTVETGARRVASGSARGLSRFTAWLAEVLGRLLSHKSDEPAVHWAVPTTVALIVPLIIGAVATSVYIQRDMVNELSQIKEQMLDEMTAAESAGGDSAEGQAHYLRLLSLASEAEVLRPGDLEVATLRADALTALDRIDGVSRLTAETFYRYAAGTNLTRIALRRQDGGIAVLDQTSNRVMLHATDDSFRNLTSEDPSTIGFGGQAVGANTMRTIFDILWLPGSAAATRDSVSMVDTTGGFFSFYPNLGDTSGVILGNSSKWNNPTAMASYLDRLYILDTEARQIWKYYASTNYSQLEGDEAIFFGGEAELDQAADFDLYAEDGSLVIVYKDGRIRYYDTRSGRIQWDETTLAQNGMVTPLIAPVAVKIVGSGLNASIFVLDPGSGRLLQLSRGGTVLTQYRIFDETGREVLTKAADFGVTDSPTRIFVVAGEQLFVAARD
ncbi:MAG: hypothetical protein KA586_01770 [Candidatus Promineofilum sp.]|nr:hypothetical protein [Promineifilum sp.]